MKTFIWANGKAQARKGANDDLIMSLAIGVWLYDTAPKNSKYNEEINSAMLSGFGSISKKSTSDLVPSLFTNGNFSNNIQNIRNNKTFSWLL